MSFLKHRVPPALVLFLLSPVIGELLSGSSPPAEFFTPFGFLILVSLYGSGAIIVRELKVRWNKGVGSMLLLGAAYGVLEEGLMATSWFSPHWPDLGVMASYGRWLGINWVWAEMLTIYHAVFSITIPILLVELAYPHRRKERWIGRKVFAALMIVLSAVTVFGVLLFSTMMNYWTPLPQYVFGIVVMFMLVYFAYRLAPDWETQGQRAFPKSVILWILAAAADLAFFLGFYSSPYLIPWPVAMLYGPLLVFVMVKFLKRFNWREKATDMHVLALCSGSLTFFLLFAPLHELDKGRKDVTTGMTLVALASALGLIWLGLRIKDRNSSQTIPNKPETYPEPEQTTRTNIVTR